jgi:hypothetical protein
MTVYVNKKNEKYIDTTSRSKTKSKQLSPFYLMNIPLYAGLVSANMENAWQFSKVYPEHVNEIGQIKSDYWTWAKKGWRDNWAHRYPMGKGAAPLFSYWDGERLDYISARKKIYAPLYANAVVKTEAYERLKEIYKQRGDITLFDFDGYDYIKLGMSLQDVINHPTRKMGHAFVLAMLLQNEIYW